MDALNPVFLQLNLKKGLTTLLLLLAIFDIFLRNFYPPWALLDYVDLKRLFMILLLRHLRSEKLASTSIENESFENLTLIGVSIPLQHLFPYTRITVYLSCSINFVRILILWGKFNLKTHFDLSSMMLILWPNLRGFWQFFKMIFDITMNFCNNVNIRLLPEVNYLYPSTKYMKWTFTQNSEVNDVLLLRVKGYRHQTKYFVLLKTFSLWSREKL